MAKAFRINRTTVRLIGLDKPKPPRLPDRMQWALYKQRVMGVWPGEQVQR